jgi:hypothetical protein
MELALVGNQGVESFTKEGKDYLEIAREYVSYNSKRQYSLATGAFETDWSKYVFLMGYMGLELKQVDSKQEALARTLAVGHKSWPDPSSVFIQNEMVIVILATP